MNIFIFFVIMVIFFFQRTAYAASGSGGSKKVIIDTDMGWDDVLSILYLMKCPDIDIVGITVTGCGETNLRWGTVIALSLMEMGGRTDVSVCKGTSTPLLFKHVFPQTFRDDMNGMMGLLGSLNPDISMEPDPRPAWQYLVETLDKTEEKITILSLGGFTSLATMLDLYPHAKVDRIEAVYAMAGAVFVDGNIALLNNARPEWDQGPVYRSNYAAEWNVFVDPLAAQKVFNSDIPLTLIPLDACNHVMLSPDDVDSITVKDDISRLAKKILEHKTGSHDEGIPVPIFDPLATLIMTGDMPGYQSSMRYLDVDLRETEMENTCGRTFVTETGSRKISVVQGVSNYAFKKAFAEVLNR